MNQTLPYEDNWLNCQLRERSVAIDQLGTQRPRHKTDDSYCTLPPARPFSGTYRQALICLEELPKKRRRTEVSVSPIGSHSRHRRAQFRILTLVRTAVPSAAECVYPCANGSSLGRRPHQPLDREERRVQVLVRDNNVDQALKVLKKK